MNVDYFRQIESIFESALALDEAEREAHVKDLAGDDEVLYRRVMRMLGHATRTLICDDLTHPVDADAGPDADDLVGRRVDRYIVQERIGEGGFGTVYRAEQLEPVSRSIALKFIKLGMDTERVLNRFEAERQALAMMDHPHIARVMDAGATPEGRPYFVMELVHGLAITRFCDEHELSLTARLRLFILVCQAIQHAHQKGVIHRDVKPSNVLVRFADNSAAPKIIDFGIAKAIQGRLTDKAVTTEQRGFVGTPEYMSPEQAGTSGANVDTRTDIYSLGVLLYELLVGITPFAIQKSHANTPDKLLHQVRESDPRRPSACLSMLGNSAEEIARRRGEDVGSLRRQLRGDLDWIVLKAIEKDPDRRYESAAELAHEVERYLSSEPIVARPPGPLYLATKFVRRNRVTVTATIVIVASLIIGFVVSVAALNRAQMAHSRTEQALELAQQRLLESLHAQARAARSSDQIGRRFQALEAIAQAAHIEPSDMLRDEAIAAMSLQDFQVVRSFPQLIDVTARGLREIDRFAHVTGPGEILIEFTDETRPPVSLKTIPKRIWFSEFTGDGRYLASKLHDRTEDADVVVWDVERQEVVLSLSGQHARHNFTLSRLNGLDVIAIVMGETIEVRSLPDGALQRTLQFSGRSSWAVGDPARERLAVSHFDDHRVSVWSLRDGQQLVDFDVPASIRDMAWHPDGSLLAGCGGDFRVYIWDSDTGNEHTVLIGHEGVPVEVYFSSDGGVLATHGWDDTTRLWGLNSGDPLVGPLLETRVAGLSDTLLTSDPNGVRLWRYESAIECQRARCQPSFGPDLDLRFSSCGTLLLTAGNNGVRLWNAKSLREVAVVMQERAPYADFSKDADSLFTASTTAVHRWPIQWIGDQLRIGPAQLVVEKDRIRGCDLDQEGNRLAICTEHGIEVIDLRTGAAILSIAARAGWSRAPLLDPSGRRMFMGSWRGSGGQLWDVEAGEIVREFPGSHVTGDFSPDGERLMVSTAGSFETFTTDSWETVLTRLRHRSSDLAGQVAFSRGRNIAAMTHSRFEIHVLDIDSGQLLAQLTPPHPAAISALAVSDDGSKVAAATAAGLILVWDLDLIGRNLDALRLQWPDR